MTEEFFIRDRRAADYTVVTIGCELDVATAPALRSHLSDLEASGRTRLVLDLAPLEFADAYGLGVLIWMAGRLQERGGWLRLVGVRPRILRLLGLARLTRTLPVYPSVTQAVATPSGPAAEAVPRDTATAPRSATATLIPALLPRPTATTTSSAPLTSAQPAATVLPQ
jgi:anti-sigma B factor antagonist